MAILITYLNIILKTHTKVQVLCTVAIACFTKWAFPARFTNIDSTNSSPLVEHNIHIKITGSSVVFYWMEIKDKAEWDVLWTNLNILKYTLGLKPQFTATKVKLSVPYANKNFTLK